MLNFGRWERSTAQNVIVQPAPPIRKLLPRRSSTTSVESEICDDPDFSVPASVNAGTTCSTGNSGEIQARFERDILEMKGAAITVLLGLLECVDNAYIPGAFLVLGIHITCLCNKQSFASGQ